MGEFKRNFEIQAEHCALHIQGCTGERRQRALPGAVDQQVHPDLIGPQCVEHLLGGILIKKVYHHGGDRRVRAKGCAQRVERLPISANYHDPHSALGALDGDAASDATVRTGYQRGLPWGLLLQSASDLPRPGWIASRQHRFAVRM